MATLNALLFCLKVIEFVAVISLLVIGADYLIYEIKYQRCRTPKHSTADKTKKLRVEQLLDEAREKLRKQKEAEAATTSFFVDSYYCNFDSDGTLIYRGATAPSDPDWEFYKKIDDIVDAEIFEKTEEL